MTTLAQAGATAARPVPPPGTLAQVTLASGGVKIGVFRGRGRCEGWGEEPRLVFESSGSPGLWLLVGERYARSLLPLAPEVEERATMAGAAPAPGGEAAAVGDRALVELRNRLTWSGFFLGRIDNPFAGGRGGILLGFAPAAPLLYWFDDGLVRRVRVTVPGALAGATAPRGLTRV